VKLGNKLASAWDGSACWKQASALAAKMAALQTTNSLISDFYFL
jgi:hypothetical protein